MALLAAALVAVTFSSCGSAVQKGYPALSLASLSTADDAAEQQSESAETIDRKLVKRGDIRFETADVNKTKSLIVQAVRELNGYISNDTVVDHSDQIEHKLTIRVPADNFDLLLQNISESVDKFDSKNIHVLDVTEEFIDVQSRIKTQKELQARYTELLNQAANVSEMLDIEREIGNLQTRIESAEGRMRYLNDRIAFSTLIVAYYESIAIDESRFSFSSQFMVGIKSGWELFLWFIIGLSYLWVFFVLGIVFVAALYWFVWRKEKKASVSQQ